MSRRISQASRCSDRKRTKFLLDEGVLAVVQDDRRARDGIDFAEAAGSQEAKDPLAPPTFRGHLRAVQPHRPPARKQDRCRDAREPAGRRFRHATPTHTTSSAKFPGGAKKDEVVMVGAHFDSWHTGTGATDNGAGSAVMMEVMRILKALNLNMDRTVRIALWSGEEQGLLGSKAYVKQHFGDPKTMKLTAAARQALGLFQPRQRQRQDPRRLSSRTTTPCARSSKQWLAPFRDLGVTTITIRNTGGTDHLSFDAVGLPGFQFIQDPLDYVDRHAPLQHGHLRSRHRRRSDAGLGGDRVGRLRGCQAP